MYLLFLWRGTLRFWGVQHHYEGHWKGWALKIETFLGPEMARAKPVWVPWYIMHYMYYIMYQYVSPTITYRYIMYCTTYNNTPPPKQPFFRTFKESTAPYKVHNMGLRYIKCQKKQTSYGAKKLPISKYKQRKLSAYMYLRNTICWKEMAETAPMALWIAEPKRLFSSCVVRTSSAHTSGHGPGFNTPQWEVTSPVRHTSGIKV
jgi:hypothetical protein